MVAPWNITNRKYYVSEYMQCRKYFWKALLKANVANLFVNIFPKYSLQWNKPLRNYFWISQIIITWIIADFVPYHAVSKPNFRMQFYTWINYLKEVLPEMFAVGLPEGTCKGVFFVSRNDFSIPRSTCSCRSILLFPQTHFGENDL